LEVPKNKSEFKDSLKDVQPPADWTDELRALWWDAKGAWPEAHALVDSLSTPDAQWIHAYLHRKEGDMWNADYWYGRAGRSRPSQSLEEEFNALLSAVLSL
jgi:hypothetical protein